MNEPTLYILIGPPACGKSTQRLLLGQTLNIPTVSTGQEFRKLAEQSPELAERLGRGHFATNQELQTLLAQIAEQYRGQSLVIDGSIRRPEQLAFHFQYWPKEQIKIIEFTLENDDIIARAHTRQLNENRDDSNNAIILERIDIYRHFEPLISAVCQENNIPMIIIDATGTVEQVHQLTVDAISNNSGGNNGS